MSKTMWICAAILGILCLIGLFVGDHDGKKTHVRDYDRKDGTHVKAYDRK